MGLGFGLLALLLGLVFPAYFRSLGALCGMAALLLGIAGEIKSRDWHCDGRGQWPARIGIALGALSLWLLPMLRQI
jgi:hypothetical protein